MVADLGETGGNDAEPLHAFFARFPCYSWNHPCWDGDDGEVNHIRHVQDAGVALIAENFFGIRVDRVDRVFVAAVFEVFDHFVTDFVGVGRRADNRDALWFENSIDDWIHFFPPVVYCLNYRLISIPQ